MVNSKHDLKFLSTNFCDSHTVLSHFLAHASLSEYAPVLEYWCMRQKVGTLAHFSSAARNFSIIGAPTDLVTPGKYFPLKETT